MLALYELARGLAGQADIGGTGDMIAKHLRRVIPFSLCVLYLYDVAADELEARHAVGDAMPLVKGLRIQLGQRLSGWVAANRQTIVNSDPTLDLGEIARVVNPRLRNCLSTPMVSEDQLVGVLTLYSSASEAYTDDHRRVLEVVARQGANTFKHALELDKRARRDPLTGLPDVVQFEGLVASSTEAGTEYALLLIDVIGLKSINLTHGRAVGDQVLRHVVTAARRGLRATDALVRSGSDEFVAFLFGTDLEAANCVASQVRRSIREQQLQLANGATLAVEATVTSVCAPSDGASLNDLITAARIQSGLPTKLKGHTLH
jgi:diguanylate cyclase (GGDEF)-like protein